MPTTIGLKTLNKEVTLYRGEDVIDTGTIKELAERRGCTPEYIYWLTMPYASQRANGRKDPSRAIVGVML